MYEYGNCENCGAMSGTRREGPNGPECEHCTDTPDAYAEDFTPAPVSTHRAPRIPRSAPAPGAILASRRHS